MLVCATNETSQHSTTGNSRAQRSNTAQHGPHTWVTAARARAVAGSGLEVAARGRAEVAEGTVGGWVWAMEAGWV